MRAGAVGWVWFFCHMPETRGCELEEIEELFTRGSDRERRKSVEAFAGAFDHRAYVVVK